MNKSLTIIIIAAALSGCSSIGNKRAESTIPSPTPEVTKNQTLAAPGKIDAPLTIDVPPWYVKAPASTDEFVYVTGTGVSSDLSMSRAKAMLDAQHQLASKINGIVDANLRQNRKDSGGTVSNDYTSLALRNSIVNTSIAGHHLEDSRIQAENRGYRTFVLIRYPIGDANQFLKAIQPSSNKTNDDAAIDRELSQPVVTPIPVSRSVPVETKPVPLGELKLMDVDNAEYRRRRAEALSKPNAVIGSTTIR
jgi:hypothetical protein